MDATWMDMFYELHLELLSIVIILFVVSLATIPIAYIYMILEMMMTASLKKKFRLVTVN